MTNLLDTVRRAATRRGRAEDAYKQAIIQAHQAGHRLTEIGAAAGLSKQGVYYLTRPDPRRVRQDAEWLEPDPRKEQKT